LKQRVITAIIGIPIVMGACFVTHPWLFGAIALLAGCIATLELAKMSGRSIALLGPLVILAPLVLPERLGQFSESLILASLTALFLLGCVAAGRRGQVALEVASLWIGAPLAALILLHQMKGSYGVDWQPWVLLPMVPLWIGDSAAIFAGKAWGKHPLAPKISPKKTWEGAIANLLGCLAGGAITAWALGLPWQCGLATGTLSGTLGQAGDLFQSSLKRRVGVKDSGSILPGHGGILDRIDSLIATAVPVALIVSLWPK